MSSFSPCSPFVQLNFGLWPLLQQQQQLFRQASSPHVQLQQQLQQQMLLQGKHQPSRTIEDTDEYSKSDSEEGDCSGCEACVGCNGCEACISDDSDDNDDACVDGCGCEKCVYTDDDGKSTPLSLDSDNNPAALCNVVEPASNKTKRKTETETETEQVESPRKYQKRKASHFTGVYFLPQSRMWRSVISVKGGTKHLGNFKDEVMAAKRFDVQVLLMGRKRNNLNFEYVTPEDYLKLFRLFPYAKVVK